MINYTNYSAANYDSLFGNKSIWEFYYEIGFNLLKQYFPIEQSKVADIGCGTGKWSIPLLINGHSVHGVDISQEMLDEFKNKLTDIKKKGDLTLHKLGIEELSNDFKENSFDLTLCMGDPISYSSDYNKAINNVAYITKKGGYILFSVDYIYGYLRVFQEKYDFDPDILAEFFKTGNINGLENLDIHAFYLDEFKSLVELSGCELVDYWFVPSVSGIFQNNSNFTSKLNNDIEFRQKMMDIELSLMNNKTSTGPTHLYGVMKKLDS